MWTVFVFDLMYSISFTRFLLPIPQLIYYEQVVAYLCQFYLQALKPPYIYSIYS